MKLTVVLLALASLCWSLAAVAAPAAPSYHRLRVIAVGGDGGWDYLTMDSAAQRLYVSRGTHTQVIDVKHDKLVGDLADTPGVHGIALDVKHHHGFTSNGGDNTVTVFDTRTLKQIARVKVGSRPDAIIFDPAARRVFTFNAESKDTTAVDATTYKVVGTTALGGKPEFPTVDECGHLFVNIEDTNEIVALDTQTLKAEHRWSIAPGDSPSGQAIDRVHHRLFSVCGNGMMVVLDYDTGKVVATPAIGNGPDAAAYDPGLGLAFSSNGRDGTLTVIRETTPNTFTVVATVPTQMGSRTMALDPKTHRIYLASARFLPQPAGETPGPRHRPNMEPGSFAILVYGP